MPPLPRFGFLGARYGNSPLWTAVFGSKGDVDVIVLLRAAGAGLHKQNASGRTPLQMARLIGNYGR